MFTIRTCIYSGIRKNKSGMFEKYNTIFLNSSEFNLLFIGSSRAETHFNPYIFDSITGLNSYNIGVTGATPRIAYAVLKAYCSKSKFPKYLVFDIDFHFLKYNIDTIRHFPRYFPFLENEELLNQFQKIDTRFKMFKYNPLYSLPYSNTRLLSASLHGWLGISGKYDSCYYKGFFKQVFSDSLISSKTDNYYSFIHVKERACLDSIILFAQKNKMNLLLTTSPMFKGGEPQLLNKKQMVDQLKNIAKINKLNYVDFSFCDFSETPSCFSDNYHMNYKGTGLFSKKFGLFFKQYLSEKTVN